MSYTQSMKADVLSERDALLHLWAQLDERLRRADPGLSERERDCFLMGAAMTAVTLPYSTNGCMIWAVESFERKRAGYP